MALRWVATGIPGFDEITGGGLPHGRVTVVFGGPGSGKTLFALQTLAVGARQHREPGIFMTFEERIEDVVANTSTFAWKLGTRRTGDVEMVDARIPAAAHHSGEFDLVGMLAMLDARVARVGAKRIVFDGLDLLLDHLGSAALAKREMLRLREWLLERQLTAVLTSKLPPPEGAINYEYLQYLADCVVSLDHRLTAGTALRFIRVSKCRGSAHSANEFPFTITGAGLEVAENPTSELAYPVSNQRFSSGIPRLDTMLGGGFYRGSAVLISGNAGTSKSTLAATFANAACARRERTVYASFDEAPGQIIRNMGSVGMDLRTHVKSGALRFLSLRARSASPESHVAKIRALVLAHRARNLIVDPLSALSQVRSESLAERAALQVLDLAKGLGITLVATSLIAGSSPVTEHSQIGISTFADTWMHLSYVVQGGERNRALTIIKSRGADHSNQVRELALSRGGVTLADVYTAGGEVLFGTLRWEKEVAEQRAREAAATDLEVRHRQAALALAESQLRVEATTHERALRQADLERVRVQQAELATKAATTHRDLLQRRRADGSRTRTGGAKR